MKSMLIGLSAVVGLAALTAGCGYSEHTYAVQAPAPAYEAPVAVPGATYYGDRYYDYPRTTYVYRGY
ncbi:MAG TPA: hypothetical protein VKY24_17380 [Reyranella sp.]|nr:hypothetical protein [Reyranella sp.]